MKDFMLCLIRIPPLLLGCLMVMIVAWFLVFTSRISDYCVQNHSKDRRHASFNTTPIPVTNRVCSTHESKIRIRNTTNSIVNTLRFEYINCPPICNSSTKDGDSRPLVLVVVYSTVQRYMLRHRIRHTWADASNYEPIRLRTVFVLGLGATSTEQAAVTQEAYRYKDIIQGNFSESYRNVNYKAVAALKWFSTNCKQASYILRTDDDVFINMFTVAKHVRDLYDSGQCSRIILCHVLRDKLIMRSGKWAVRQSEMPGSIYLSHCNGVFVLMSADVAIAIYRASLKVPHFWISDIYMFGLLIQRMRATVTVYSHISRANTKKVNKKKSVVTIKHTDIVSTMCEPNHMSVLFVHPTEWYKYAFTRVLDQRVFWSTWSRLHYFSEIRTIPTPIPTRAGVLADKYMPLSNLVQPLNKSSNELR